MIVVSDTSPIRALAFLEQLTVLEQLFGAVVIPPAVVDELARACCCGGAFDCPAPQFSLQPGVETLIPKLAQRHTLSGLGVLHESQVLRVFSVGPTAL